MKIIASLVGAAGINVAAEEIIPARGISQRDFANYVTSAYQFAVNPLALISQSPDALAILDFRGGFFTSEEHGRIPITQLISTTDGDLILTQNTELSEIVLADLLRRLESDLQYSITGKEIKKIFSSSMLVEFDEEAISSINDSEFSRQLNVSMENPERPYVIKRLTFGQSASNATLPTPSVLQLISRDFVIERRANEPMSRNRFFCTAPVTTERHAEILGSFEASLRQLAR